MIGYPISREDLDALIEMEKPGWLKRAGERTEKFREAKEYKEKSSIWSEVKPAYMKFQGDGKCVYCERKLESIDYGKSEQDVEHFRPKGNIRSWRAPKQLKDQGVSTAAVPNEKGGYYLLSYQPFNYAASCKPCNSALKLDYFPIAGEYNLSGDDPKKLISEQPYLIYPIGDFDKAPEDLISFHGVSPRAVANDGHDRLRALVTIEFFKLDDTKRKNLLRERAVIILALYPQLEKLANSATGADKISAEEIIDGFTSPKSCHTNCARCFKALHDLDRIEAKEVFDRAVDLIMSTS